jgi:hypothetical protein
MGKANAERPRWRKPPPGPALVIKGRAARKLAAAIKPPAPAQTQPEAPVRVFRFRYHLVPVWWLAGMLAVGLGSHAARSPAAGLITAFAAAAGMVLLTRHLDGKPRAWWQVMAALTALLVPALSLSGPIFPLPLVLLACWAAVMVRWVSIYRWRPLEPQPEAEASDHERWNALAEQQKWNGHLGTVEQLPGGGRRYPIQLDGIKTTIRNVLAASENVAGAWHKPMTEAFAERDPAGITSRGYLTILGRETLMGVREWNGHGVDPATGMAVIGRYADGSPAHMKFYTPRYGTRHALISGTTGSGKSELLHLLIFAVLASGRFVPVILDPQNGQSLPFWRGRCLYAEGEDECIKMLNGLHAGMMDRSAYLASLRWDDDGIAMRGMPFFDAELTGLPMPLIMFDEAHMILNPKVKALAAPAGPIAKTVEIARLARKTGCALELATHIPGLGDLGGEQALRDMLRGGGVVSMRTANRVGKGMLGLEKDPSEIPAFFTDGKETYGLGYTAGPDNRPDAPFRSDLVPKAMRRNVPPVPQLDDRFKEAMDKAMRKSVIASVPPPALITPAAAADGETDGPAGRAAADAILAVLGGELDRGEILTHAAAHVTGTWGRGKPFSVRAMSDALAALERDGRIRKIRHGVYAPARTTLRAVPADTGGTGESPHGSRGNPTTGQGKG